MAVLSWWWRSVFLSWAQATQAEELNWEECLRFTPGVSKYACSKLAMHVFSQELDRRQSHL